MNDTNKKYYKRVYDEVYASEDLRERVLSMKGNHLEENQAGGARQKKRKSAYRRVWRAAAATVALAVAVPLGVYAATQHRGLSDFFEHALTKEADQLVERDVVVQTTDQPDREEMPVDFKVREALCDSGSVNIVLEAKVKEKEKGRYLLVQEGMLPSESVSNLGIKGNQKIGEYAKSKGLKLLYIGHGFADSSEFAPSCYTSDALLEGEDTLVLYLSTTEKKSGDKDLNVAVKCSVSGASGGKGSFYSTLNFKLQDKSSSSKVSYTSGEKIVLKDVKAVVTRVTMEKSAQNTYVTIYYRYKGKSREEIEDDNLSFDIKDNIGEERGNCRGRWDEAFFGGTGGIDVGDGTYCCKLTYTSMEFPEKCVLVAHEAGNGEKNVIYGEFELSKVKK